MADEQLKQQKIQKQKPMKEIKNKDNEIKLAEATKVDNNVNKKEEKIEETKTEIKKTDKKKKLNKEIKKTEAVIYARNLPISLKHAVGIGKFIKNKKIDDAINILNKVSAKKLAVPFSGEMAHKKGKGMMTGKYPVNASKEFIKLLKTLSANSNVNGMDLDKTRIAEIIPNKAPKRFHRFGSTQFKSIHIMIKAKEMGGKPKVMKEAS